MLAAIDMNDSFFGLRSEDVQRTHGEAIGRGRGFFEGVLGRGKGLVDVQVDADLAGGGRRG